MLPYLVFLKECFVLFFRIIMEFLYFIERLMEGKVQEREIEDARSCLYLWFLLTKVREFSNNFEALFELLFFVDFLKFKYQFESLKVIKIQN